MAGAASSSAQRGEGGTPTLELDDLLDLDFDDLIGESPRKQPAVKLEQSAPVKSEVKTEDTTPVKRRRVHPSFAASGSASRESWGSSHGVAEVGEVADSPGGESAQEHKACLGCARILGVSPCWLTLGDTMQWALPNGRGSWCKDCYTTHRTSFKSRTYLTDLHEWMKTNPEEREMEWQLSRVAYLSLAFEGNLSKIEKPQVQQRVELMRWMSRVCCMSFAGHVVVPFEEAARVDSPYRSFAAQPSNLTTIFSEGGHRLGVLVPMNMSRGQAGVMDRPTLPDEVLPLPHQRFLMSTNPADGSLVSELFQVSVPLGTAPESQAGPEAVVPRVDDRPRTRFEKRLDALSYACTAVLDTFTSDDWKQTPESAFTNPVTKAAKLMQEARQVAPSEEVLEAASAWSEGLSAGKQFLKLYKNYEKSNHKAERLAGLLPHLQQFCAFLIGPHGGRTVAPSLRQVILQATFRAETLEFASAAAACSNLVKNGLMSAWNLEGGQPSGGGKPGAALPEVWLRSMVHDVVARDLLTLKTAAEHGERVWVLANDLSGVHDVLKEVSDTAGVFRPVVMDTVAMMAVLSAWKPDEVDVALLSDARTRLGSARLAPFKKALQETDVGCEILMNMAKGLQASAQDQAGDEKLSSALTLLHSGREPFAGQDATSTREIANFDAAKNLIRLSCGLRRLLSSSSKLATCGRECIAPRRPARWKEP